ncbi:MAG: hypothetical protein FWG98_06690 [Candidatus Cloacimonetes bacterium]|nr:hypothetical protein [Candidatus Cloacimonadota bacterium]
MSNLSGGFTQKMNLYKPTPGESGIAAELNNNWDKIAGHAHSEYALKTEILNVNHTHPEYASNASLTELTNSASLMNTKITAIENTLGLLLPNLGTVELSANFTNQPNGFRIHCSSTPSVYISYWNIKIRLSSGGAIVYNESHSSSSIFVSHHEMPGVLNSQVLYIEIILHVGHSTKSVTRTHNYTKMLWEHEAQIKKIEDDINNLLSAGDLVKAMVQDAEFINILSNSLQHSNSLAQKVAELSK